MSSQMPLVMTGTPPFRSLVAADHFPIHFRSVVWHPAVYVTVEIFHDLSPTLLPPRLDRRNFLAMVQEQGIGKLRVMTGASFVIIRGVRRLRVPVRARAQGRDMQGEIQQSRFGDLAPM